MIGLRDDFELLYFPAHFQDGIKHVTLCYSRGTLPESAELEGRVQASLKQTELSGMSISLSEADDSSDVSLKPPGPPLQYSPYGPT